MDPRFDRCDVIPGLTPLENYDFKTDDETCGHDSICEGSYADTSQSYLENNETPIFDEESLRDLCLIVDREMRERIRADKLKYLGEAGLPLDLQSWSVFQCACWFRWMTAACGVEDTFSNDVIRNGLDGQLLCAMTEQDFRAIFAAQSGNDDIVFQTLQYWKSVRVNTEDVSNLVDCQVNRHASSRDPTKYYPQWPESCEDYAYQGQYPEFPLNHIYPNNRHMSGNGFCRLDDTLMAHFTPPDVEPSLDAVIKRGACERGYVMVDMPTSQKNVKRNRSKTQPILWRFILECLNNQKMTKSLQWVNKRDGTFKFFSKHKEEIAHAWGKLKNRKRMTYQKMARALRDYAGKGIMKKVKRKLHYRFLPNVMSQLSFGSSGCPSFSRYSPL
ncbi:transcription factor ETV7-like [Ptychodera flava]|uniref:transcription factor ETV7-like n=1 Tax=Ptychodera flava TaxID=63121 RepID=UPI00396A35BF